MENPLAVAAVQNIGVERVAQTQVPLAVYIFGSIFHKEEEA